VIAIIAPALADPIYCSTWQQITTCSSPGGYVSHETQWTGFAATHEASTEGAFPAASSPAVIWYQASA
jgi:hypothetical protein